MAHNFKELDIWKKSMVLVKDIYLLLADLPSQERFGLISQIQRSAVSIPSNIAEGSGRKSDKEFNYFLTISLSSSFELETQLLLSEELYQLNVNPVLTDLNTIQRMIVGFKKRFELQSNI